MSARIVAVGRSRRDRVRFWRAGLVPYADAPHFVTPLLMDCHGRWSPANPLFTHVETQHFVATRDGRDVGRIAATVDRAHDDFHGDRIGFFGWFECEDDATTAALLLRTARDWLHERGRERMRGPLSYTTNGVSGLLVEDAHPGPPFIDMAYNPPRYEEHFAAAGLEPAKDLLAFLVPIADVVSPRLMRVADRIEARGSYTLRPIRMDREEFAADVEHILRIYNTAWERNWGFVPMSPDEIRHEARGMRAIVIPELLLFAEHDGIPVAFSLTLPDMNQALAAIQGRLWPWSIVRLLRAKARIDRVRVLTLGIVPEHRRAGLESLLILRSAEAGHALGMTHGECGWVLEDNHLMTKAIERVGGTAHRRYRLYESDPATNLST